MKDKIGRIREILREAAGEKARKTERRNVYRPTVWRMQRLVVIMERCCRYGWLIRLGDHIGAKYGAVMPDELSDVQLQQTYRMVTRWSIKESSNAVVTPGRSAPHFANLVTKARSRS